MYDHSLRPPMIVVGPGIPKGEKREMVVYLQDIIPTEMNDLASDPGQQERVRSMFSELVVLQAEMGDTLDLAAFF